MFYSFFIRDRVDSKGVPLLYFGMFFYHCVNKKIVKKPVDFISSNIYNFIF